jgi:hypothetical protein
VGEGKKERKRERAPFAFWMFCVQFSLQLFSLVFIHSFIYFIHPREEARWNERAVEQKEGGIPADYSISMSYMS